jgi:purine-nucleoside phosphorylase
MSSGAAIMEVTYPGWLNKDFLETTLRSAGDLSARVVSYDVAIATAAGDNYMSDMYRVTVEVTRAGDAEVTSLIVKAAKETKFLDEV